MDKYSCSQGEENRNMLHMSIDLSLQLNRTQKNQKLIQN